MRTSTDERRIDSTNTVNLAQQPLNPIVDTDVAAMAKLTNKIDVTHGKSIKATHSAVSLLDTVAGVNFIKPALIPP